MAEREGINTPQINDTSPTNSETRQTQDENDEKAENGITIVEDPSLIEQNSNQPSTETNTSSNDPKNDEITSNNNSINISQDNEENQGQSEEGENQNLIGGTMPPTETPNQDKNDNISNDIDTQDNLFNNNNSNTQMYSGDETSRSKSSKTSHKYLSSRPVAFFMQQADPKEVEASLESLMKHNTPPIEQLREPVMQLISHKKLDALIESDYDLAERYDKAAEILQKNGADVLFERAERIRKLTIDDRADTIVERLENVKQKYQDQIKNAKQERQKALCYAQDQHEKQNQEFRQKWQDPAFLSKFKKPSQELLQLRFIEKKLALSKYYDEAKEKKLLADKQQKIEEKKMQENIEEEMKKEFFKLKEEQYQELNKISVHYESMITSIGLQRDKEVQSIEYALRQMEIKKNTIPNKKLHSLPKDLCQINELDTDTSQTCKTSSRTAAKMSLFKNEKKGKLKVTPIAESVLSKLISAHPIVRPVSKFKIKSKPPSRIRRL
ncbi:hypothetical protein TRFO_36556 [Tritrichomonas foetus]|uniref:Uncharacterized protein n=1 Tax=Tritrichomonas foetus TaxID=1144522 RepID=A0A1J4JDG2_9EUKA|nr:hypothetical protein TRFO_36556 [Tritrichomonas foetus]|eukprot:OHS97238.1 hypothetical protein TRFO_36556 [Tritrichomonas foetus]